jgi:ABC-2 type transport system ATP-binding protein
VTSQPSGSIALQARRLGFRLRARGEWALRDCSFTLPTGRITALVGPNGAGKSTLFRLATDLLRPDEGEIRVFGSDPGTPEARRRVAFLSQDKPLYPRYTVADMLRLGRELNSRWDQALAERVVRAGDIRLDARTGSLSGGQATRVALALALGKRPDLLLLDEPLADLDPVVREEIMATLLVEVAESELSVVLSSHTLPDIEHTCDYLLLLRDGGVRLCGDADEVRKSHVLLTGHAPGDSCAAVPVGLENVTVVQARTTGRQYTTLARLNGPPPEGNWVSEQPSLEEVVLGYLRAPAGDSRQDSQQAREVAA